eukprot:GHVQ01041906.1.p1 GENE.GHVQ01041906.1~~GHVQ01041906.1.p1  ORF type:complete len:495 (+),score=108.85 GHVQ01041906.1:149-1633(+)
MSLTRDRTVATNRPPTLRQTWSSGYGDRWIDETTDKPKLEDSILLHSLQQDAWLKQPSRKQVQMSATSTNSAYSQGQEHYNIWYHKFATHHEDRGQRQQPADTRCHTKTDCGWTRADKVADSASNYYCLYFAKGSCSMGSACHYRHRLPVEEDDRLLDAAHDCFGRERFAMHKDDMGGVGSFTDECRTLYIGRLHVDRATYDYEGLTETVRNHFSEWGPIEHLRLLPGKGIGFVTYKFRVSAEFAKVAMADQSLGNCGQLINVRWANAVTPDVAEKLANQRRIADSQAVEQAQVVQERLGKAFSNGCIPPQHHSQMMYGSSSTSSTSTNTAASSSSAAAVSGIRSTPVAACDDDYLEMYLNPAKINYSDTTSSSSSIVPTTTTTTTSGQQREVNHMTHMDGYMRRKEGGGGKGGAVSYPPSSYSSSASCASLSCSSSVGVGSVSSGVGPVSIEESEQRRRRVEAHQSVSRIQNILSEGIDRVTTERNDPFRVVL